MEYKELIDRLAQEGIRHQLEPLESLYGITGVKERVHCLLHAEGGNRGYAGFWLHVGSDLAFVGLWSGVFWQIRDPGKIIRLTHDLMEYCSGTKPRTPWVMPSGIVEDYSLERRAIVMAWPEGGSDRLDEVQQQVFDPSFSMNGFVDAVGARVDSCDPTARGFVVVTKGGVQLTTRFPCNPTEEVASLVVLVHGEVPGTRQQTRLLQVVSEACGCVLYDHVWNNRIYWDDPYYSAFGAAGAPEMPRNAWPIR